MQFLAFVGNLANGVVFLGGVRVYEYEWKRMGTSEQHPYPQIWLLLQFTVKCLCFYFFGNGFA